MSHQGVDLRELGLEGAPVDRTKHGLRLRADGRAALRLGEHRQLADDLAGAARGDRLACDYDFELAPDDLIGRRAVCAFFEEHLARSEPDALGASAEVAELRELFEHRLHRRRPRFGRRGEHLGADGAESLRHLGPELVHRRRAALIGRPARQELEEQSADGVDVCSRAQRRVGIALLGRHVGRRTSAERAYRWVAELGLARTREVASIGHWIVEPRHSPVDERDVPEGLKHHVVRLDVQMQNALVVCVGDRLAHPRHDPKGLRDGEVLALGAQRAEPCR